jgi:hypothetical protein
MSNIKKCSAYQKLQRKDFTDFGGGEGTAQLITLSYRVLEKCGTHGRGV